MRILILANGDEPSPELFEKLRGKCDYFIAADGGGNTAINLGSPPDVVIGDLDSFQQNASYKGRVLYDADQETNDLEKALNHALFHKANRVDVLGATGRRLDHTLKNLSVMQRFNRHFDPLAYYDDRLCSLILPRDFSISLPSNHPVSLFPLSGKVDGIVTEGLEYRLKDESLENGRRDGSSNRTTGKSIRIRHRTGTLLFMTGLTETLLQ